MNPIKELIENAAKLAERAIPAFEAEDRLKKIEPLYNSVVKEAEQIQKSAELEKQSFRSGLNRISDVLVTRGILEESNKLAFVDSISKNPSEVFNVLDKLASELKAESFGQPSKMASQDELDPFERLVIEG
jgi:hypothetical protein